MANIFGGLLGGAERAGKSRRSRIDAAVDNAARGRRPRRPKTDEHGYTPVGSKTSTRFHK